MAISLEALALRMHKARAEILRIKAARAAHICLHEQALEAELAKSHALFMPNPHDDKWKPCWKGKRDGNDYYALGDEREDGWCQSCTKREALRMPLLSARLRLAGLMSQFWARAARIGAEGKAA